jgi:hypothetical protein
MVAAALPPPDTHHWVAPASGAHAVARKYTVRPGDDLKIIARRFYGAGAAHMWRTIWYANRHLIGANPNLIFPGQRLIIPQGASFRHVAGNTGTPTAGNTKAAPTRATRHATLPANPTENEVIRAVLALIGAPHSGPGATADLQGMRAWYLHENTGWPPAATRNPWNSTLWAPGATAFNSNGGNPVWNYAHWEQGIHRTAATLLNGDYPQIVNRLRAGLGLCGWSSPEFGTWSDGGYFSVCPG